MQYYFSIDGTNQQGPVDRDQLIAAGVTARTQVWRDGLTTWTAAGEVPELASLFAPTEGAYDVAPASVSASGPAVQPAGDAQQMQYESLGPYQVQPNNAMAIASLVLGIVGIASTCVYGLGALPGLLAVIFGHMGRAQIRRGQGGGDGMALAGLIMGYISVAIAVIFIGLIIFFFIAVGVNAANARPRITPAPPTPKIPGPAGMLFNVLYSMLVS